MYYPGNKNIPGLIQKIVNQIPPCKNFYEPFAGSAAVSTFLSIASLDPVQFFINDLDPAVTAKFNYPAGSTVTNKRAFDIIRFLLSVSDGNETFVFLDPPYMHSTRLYSQNLYNYEMTDLQHYKLLSAVRDLKCNCMIIHPQCDFYDYELKDWRTVQLSVRYHNKTSIENLYMNYPRPEQLLTYVSTGTDCWDRQRIKRKGDRLVKKLLSLSALERNYIISRIQNISLCLMK